MKIDFNLIWNYFLMMKTNKMFLFYTFLGLIFQFSLWIIVSYHIQCWHYNNDEKTKINLQLFHHEILFMHFSLIFNFLNTKTFLLTCSLNDDFTTAKDVEENQIWNSCLLQVNCFILNFVIPSTLNNYFY